MTQVEMMDITAAYLEVTAEFMGNYATHVGIYLSLIFGYCVVAYIAGDKLTRFQIILASTMFIAAAELQATLMYTWVASTQEVLNSIAEINPKIKGKAEFGPIHIFGVSVMQLGILASLAFMWSVRHPKAESRL
jgi:glucan phosphoethanolaminetransferase (alkaline phosphatase superfamily)